MKVKDIMTYEPKFCRPETKLHNAVKAMKSGNCGALPVIDKTQKVIGMITDRDIALSLATKDPLPAAQRNVEDIMSLKIHTVKTEDDISAALRQMRINRVGRLPVVDSDGKLKGIVSLHNLLLGRGRTNDEEFPDIASEGENLPRTIIALSDRYSGKPGKRTRFRTAL